jgi:hypothetical protein
MDCSLNIIFRQSLILGLNERRKPCSNIFCDTFKLSLGSATFEEAGHTLAHHICNAK